MILNRISLFWTWPGLIWVVLVGELSVREVFCVLGRIWRPACGSRLGVRSCWEMYIADLLMGVVKTSQNLLLRRFKKPWSKTPFRL